MNNTEKAYYDLGYSLQEGMPFVNWYYAMGAVARWPYTVFPEYVLDANKDRVQGEAFHVGYNKYVLHNWGKISGDPSESSLCVLVRDRNGYDPDGTKRIWIEKEYCIKGTKRWHIDRWYIVKVDYVDSSTPPTNDTASWVEKPA